MALAKLMLIFLLISFGNFVESCVPSNLRRILGDNSKSVSSDDSFFKSYFLPSKAGKYVADVVSELRHHKPSDVFMLAALATTIFGCLLLVWVIIHDEGVRLPDIEGKRELLRTLLEVQHLVEYIKVMSKSLCSFSDSDIASDEEDESATHRTESGQTLGSGDLKTYHGKERQASIDTRVQELNGVMVDIKLPVFQKLQRSTQTASPINTSESEDISVSEFQDEHHPETRETLQSSSAIEVCDKASNTDTVLLCVFHANFRTLQSVLDSETDVTNCDNSKNLAMLRRVDDCEIVHSEEQKVVRFKERLTSDSTRQSSNSMIPVTISDNVEPEDSHIELSNTEDKVRLVSGTSDDGMIKTRDVKCSSSKQEVKDQDSPFGVERENLDYLQNWKDDQVFWSSTTERFSETTSYPERSSEGSEFSELGSDTGTDPGHLRKVCWNNDSSTETVNSNAEYSDGVEQTGTEHFTKADASKVMSEYRLKLSQIATDRSKKCGKSRNPFGLHLPPTRGNSNTCKPYQHINKMLTIRQEKERLSRLEKEEKTSPLLRGHKLLEELYSELKTPAFGDGSEFGAECVSLATDLSIEQLLQNLLDEIKRNQSSTKLSTNKCNTRNEESNFSAGDNEHELHSKDTGEDDGHSPFIDNVIFHEDRSNCSGGNLYASEDTASGDEKYDFIAPERLTNDNFEQEACLSSTEASERFACSEYESSISNYKALTNSDSFYDIALLKQNTSMYSNSQPNGVFELTTKFERANSTKSYIALEFNNAQISLNSRGTKREHDDSIETVCDSVSSEELHNGTLEVTEGAVIDAQACTFLDKDRSSVTVENVELMASPKDDYDNKLVAGSTIKSVPDENRGAIVNEIKFNEENSKSNQERSQENIATIESKNSSKFFSVEVESKSSLRSVNILSGENIFENSINTLLSANTKIIANITFFPPNLYCNIYDRSEIFFKYFNESSSKDPAIVSSEARSNASDTYFATLYSGFESSLSTSSSEFGSNTSLAKISSKSIICLCKNSASLADVVNGKVKSCLSTQGKSSVHSMNEERSTGDKDHENKSEDVELSDLSGTISDILSLDLDTSSGESCCLRKMSDNNLVVLHDNQKSIVTDTSTSTVTDSSSDRLLSFFEPVKCESNGVEDTLGKMLLDRKSSVQCLSKGHLRFEECLNINLTMLSEHFQEESKSSDTFTSERNTLLQEQREADSLLHNTDTTMNHQIAVEDTIETIRSESEAVKNYRIEVEMTTQSVNAEALEMKEREVEITEDLSALSDDSQDTLESEITPWEEIPDDLETQIINKLESATGDLKQELERSILRVCEGYMNEMKYGSHESVHDGIRYVSCEKPPGLPISPRSHSPRVPLKQRIPDRKSIYYSDVLVSPLETFQERHGVPCWGSEQLESDSQILEESICAEDELLLDESECNEFSEELEDESASEGSSNGNEAICEKLSSTNETLNEQTDSIFDLDKGRSERTMISGASYDEEDENVEVISTPGVIEEDNSQICQIFIDKGEMDNLSCGKELGSVLSCIISSTSIKSLEKHNQGESSQVHQESYWRSPSSDNNEFPQVYYNWQEGCMEDIGIATLDKDSEERYPCILEVMGEGSDSDKEGEYLQEIMYLPSENPEEMVQLCFVSSSGDIKTIASKSSCVIIEEIHEEESEDDPPSNRLQEPPSPTREDTSETNPSSILEQRIEEQMENRTKIRKCK